MRILNRSLLLLLFITALLGACRKENIDELILKDPDYKVDTVAVNPFIIQMRALSPDTLSISCVKVPLPLDFLQESGNVITINTEEEFEEAEMLNDPIVDFVYPFTALVGVELRQISSIEELAEAIIDCSTTGATCGDLKPYVLLFYNALNIFSINQYPYSINYPVTLIVEGNSKVINNNNEFLPAIGGNPSRILEVQLVYPITIKQFGRDIVLNSDEDVCAFHETLSEDCENKPAHIQFFFKEGPGSPINCTYFIEYPVSINFNGNITEIDSRDEYVSLLNSAPTAYDNINLVYPVSALKFNGGQIIFGADDEICTYLNNCQ
jgi:hypothetical protein